MSNRRLTPAQLHDRLSRFGIAVCENIRTTVGDPISKYCVEQLIRSSTSPAANYSEAMEAESRRDFIHKLKICLKELREALYWLHFKAAVAMPNASDDALMTECRELIAILVASVKTARGGLR
jgi:four helix bundle protein